MKHRLTSQQKVRKFVSALGLFLVVYLVLTTPQHVNANLGCEDCTYPEPSVTSLAELSESANVPFSPDMLTLQTDNFLTSTPARN